MSRTTAGTTTTQSGSRKKATKAVVAGAVGVALLAGGGGSFARWYDSQTIDQGTIASGTLDIVEMTPGAWTEGGQPIVLDDFVVVPGDTLTYTNTVTVNGEGNNLSATLTTNLADLTSVQSELIEALDVDFTVNGTTYPVGSGMQLATDDATGTFTGTYDVVMTVTFPEYDAEGLAAPDEDHASWWHQYAQDESVDLGALTIVLEQNAR